MEYLAILAAIFLPLNLLTVWPSYHEIDIWKGVFGMNIRELNGSSPAWWIPVLVSLPGTFVICVFIFLGNSAWKEYRKKRLNNHWTRRYADV
jgi:Mg2+ and Co2+ transporter CorA